MSLEQDIEQIRQLTIAAHQKIAQFAQQNPDAAVAGEALQHLAASQPVIDAVKAQLTRLPLLEELEKQLPSLQKVQQVVEWINQSAPVMQQVTAKVQELENRLNAHNPALDAALDAVAAAAPAAAEAADHAVASSEEISL